MTVLPIEEWAKLLGLLVGAAVLVFVGRITNAQDDPRVQLALGVLTLLATALVFVAATDAAATWEVPFLSLLGVSFLGRYWLLTRSRRTEDLR